MQFWLGCFNSPFRIRIGTQKVTRLQVWKGKKKKQKKIPSSSVFYDCYCFVTEGLEEEGTGKPVKVVHPICLKSLASVSYVLILSNTILKGERGEEGDFFWYSVPHLCPQIGWEIWTAKPGKIRSNLSNSISGSFWESFLGVITHNVTRANVLPLLQHCSCPNNST